MNANDRRSFWLVLPRLTPAPVGWLEDDPLWEGQKSYLIYVLAYLRGMRRISMNFAQYLQASYYTYLFIVQRLFFFIVSIQICTRRETIVFMKNANRGMCMYMLCTECSIDLSVCRGPCQYQASEISEEGSVSCKKRANNKTRNYVELFCLEI